MKIAIIGSGITGLSAAWLLNKNGFDIKIFEQNNYIGGHSNTVEEKPHPAVDTGFIVYNEETYPNLIALFDLLGVKRIKTNMGFAVSLNNGALEYSGDALFAQKKNYFSFSYYQMLLDIVRFYKSAPKVMKADDKGETLGEYLKTHNYSKSFIQNHLLPMAGAIWSMSAEDTARFPLKSFVQFFYNHGLLRLKNRPQWWTVEGGSRNYVQILTKEFNDKILLNTKIEKIERNPDFIEVFYNGAVEKFDKVIFATHTDQALKILGQNATADEREVLTAIPYTPNIAYLHSDENLMPRAKKVWSSWNYFSDTSDGKVYVTYWMNNLQKFLPQNQNLFVSLNPPTPPVDSKIIKKINYEHPHFTENARKAWTQISGIQNSQNCYFGGAWCGYGFHEDGITAGLTMAEMISGKKRPWSAPDKSPAGEHIRGNG